MHFSTKASALVLAAALASAKEMPRDEVKAAELYDSGVMHEHIMSMKMNWWQEELESGALNSSQWPRLNPTKCVNGYAEAIKGDKHHKFKCKNMDLYDFISHSDLGSPNADSAGRSGSSSWGWTDPESGREFVASGMFDGTAFIEILPTGRMKQRGFLPNYGTVGPRSLWREIRSYKHFMVIGSEREEHGIQIFDMKKLLTVGDTPKLYDNAKDLTGHFDELPLGRTHNVVINEELEYGVAVGAAPRDGGCFGGLIFFDLKDPSNPTKIACDPQDGYTHDAQCLVYRGPHTKYQGRDICYAYNEDTLTIYDVTDKKASKIISRTSYEGATYTHQGWVLDTNWQEYLVLDDEYDEEDVVGPAADGYPVTYIWDIRNLEAPKQTGLYKASVKGIDHNQYVINNLVYQSNYGAGVRVYDVSSIPEDPTGNSVCEIAYFDIYPEDDEAEGGGIIKFVGSWSSYAYFKSGYIFVNTIERGAFVVKMTRQDKCKPKACNADNCLRAMRANTVPGRLQESQEFCGEFTKAFVADVSVVKDYAKAACTGNVISRVSSACQCLPTS